MTKNELTLESMGNIIAYKLGKVGLELIRYPEASIGDEIDRGLVLLRLLNESGFKILHEKVG